MNENKFKKIIWEYYKKHKRDFPWRRTRDPYKILVSEIMLQQTQAPRVVSKYTSFLKKFPSIQALARAPLARVLSEWQGLGYNRRAVYLKQCAARIESDFKGKFPKDFKLLCTLPGIGPATAGDILAFAWNLPVVVIETNIRSVFIHFFFKDKTKVHDKKIIPLVERTLPKKPFDRLRAGPREWYAALLDYGAYLKKTSNPSRQSAHYATQSKFIGSYRQKRACVLRTILENSNKGKTRKEIQNITQFESKVLSNILADLEKEGFIKKRKDSCYWIA